MQTCRYENCASKPRGLGYCPGHYRLVRLGQPLRPLATRQRNQGRTCTGPSCNRPAESKGLCSSHRSQHDRGRPLAVIGEVRPGPKRQPLGDICSFDGCGRTTAVRSLCNTHYQQTRRGIQLRPIGQRPPRPARQCSVEDCELDAEKKALCGTHYAQHWRSGRTKPIRRSNGRRVDPDSGYAYVKRPGHPEARDSNWGAEHRIVMSDLLGRPLFPDESVHHKNGARDDNRPENLELWSRWQPPGQRVEDKVAYARELLARYQPTTLPPD